MDVPARSATPVDVRAGEHIVAIYSNADELDAMLDRYVRDGLVSDHSCTVCLSADPNTRVLDRLRRSADANADAASHVSVCNATAQPPTSGAEAADALWRRLRSEHGLGAHRCARCCIEPGAWLPRPARRTELLRFESRLVTLAEGHPIAFIFMYDLSDLDGGLVVELARTHPTVWVSGTPLANPYVERTSTVS